MSSSKQNKRFRGIKEKGKIINLIIGLNKSGNEQKKRNNNELYLQNKKLSVRMRKQKITFYGHLI